MTTRRSRAALYEQALVKVIKGRLAARRAAEKEEEAVRDSSSTTNSASGKRRRDGASSSSSSASSSSSSPFSSDSQSSVPKRGSDIDDIFADGKQEAVRLTEAAEKKRRKKQKREQAEREAEEDERKRRAAKRQDRDGVPYRVDQETGMKIYSASSLKIGQGGGTDLCPFDCQCCF